MKIKQTIYTLDPNPSIKDILSFLENRVLKKRINFNARFFKTKKEINQVLIYQKWHIDNSSGKFSKLGKIKKIVIQGSIIKIIKNIAKI